MRYTQAYKSKNLQLRIHLSNFHSQKLITSSANIMLSRQPKTVIYSNANSLDKLNCTHYVDFGKCQDRFGQFAMSKNDSSHLMYGFTI